MLQYTSELPVADPSVVYTVTVKEMERSCKLSLCRSIEGRANSVFSSTSNVNCSNFMIAIG